jgi:hypothetical protein
MAQRAMTESTLSSFSTYAGHIRFNVAVRRRPRLPAGAIASTNL